jgi:putative Holliday junction resolvase
MGSILAIDYGLKRVGLAISDPERSFAFPCDVIENKNFNYLIAQISNLILEKEVDLILIGMPYNMNKSNSDVTKNEMEKNVELFIKQLQKSIKVPLKTVDERLSSFAAEEKLREAGISAKKSKKYIDSEAARLLLEEFIQNQS